MDTEEHKAIAKAYYDNYNRCYPSLLSEHYSEHFRGIAHEDLCHGTTMVATVIDYLRGNIKGVEPTTMKQPHPPAEPNGDPAPLKTEVLKRLGELGLQSLKEIRGFKYDSDQKFLIMANNRYADTGWVAGDPHIKALSDIMAEFDIPFLSPLKKD